MTVATTLGGIDPFIVAVDRFFQKTIGFSFCVGAPCIPVRASRNGSRRAMRVKTDIQLPPGNVRIWG
jgi:hypothetical protein